MFLHQVGPSLAGVSYDHLPALVAGALVAPLAWLLSRRLDSTLLATTGGIHLLLVPAHLAADPFTAAMFALNGAIFLVLAAALPHRGWLRWPALGMLAATILAYGVYVLAGREHFDGLGSATKMLEIVAFGVLLMPGAKRAAASMLVLTLLTGVAGWGGILRDHAGAAMQPLSAQPDSAHQAAAREFAVRVWNDITPYQDQRTAMAAGYHATTPPEQATSHWENKKFKQRGRVLDAQHPEALVYANTKHGPVLLGAMFELPKADLRGPDFGGAVAGWHAHPNVCVSVFIELSGLVSPFGNCPPLSLNIGTNRMLHIWRLDMPNGPYGELDEAWAKRL